MSTAGKTLSVLVILVALLALGLVGLRSLPGPAAWAQGGAPAAAPAPPAPPAAGAPAAEEPGHEGHGHAGPPGAASPPPEGPPLPDAKAALKEAASPDLAVRLKGITSLQQVFMGSQDKALLAAVEKVLTQAALHGETSSIRSAALTGLSYGGARTGPALLQATQDPDPDVRSAAVAGLRNAPPSAAINARLEQLSHATEPALAAQATDVLMGRYAAMGPSGIPLLAAQLGNPRGDAHSKAALGLDQLKGAAVPALIEVLRTSSNALQRRGAALVLTVVCAGRFDKQSAFAKETLVQIKIAEATTPPDRRPLPQLLASLAADPDALVRESCAQALGVLGDARAVRGLATAMLKDPADEVRARAASALVLLPGEQALAELEQAVTTDTSPRVRRFAVEALGWSDDPRAGRALAVGTRDVFPEVRRLACNMLGRLQPAEAVEALVPLVSDQVEEVRWSAVVALDKLRDRRAEKALVAATDDTSVLVSRAAETALMKMGITRRSEKFMRQR